MSEQVSGRLDGGEAPAAGTATAPRPHIRVRPGCVAGHEGPGHEGAPRSVHPVVQIFEDAARAVPGYPLAPLVTDEFCILIGPGNAATLIAVYFDDVATLWVDQYMWSEYEWSDRDTGELGFLAEAVAAVQRGDGAWHFRQDDGRLVHLGGRIGSQVIGSGGVHPPPLTLPLIPWPSQLGPAPAGTG
ncbi:hypothetical protein [Streptomyces spirodelae]|uniref:Uncharacterized protein n=1 Tax=Streptomyces spirodelae TaxID=2812904 RepID=A0ABS3WT53_9ACTN|nr:hypothetical protein [Streptomyces spirodelae]MBO8186310.1 hypothetical protein [Streptomyces spirodelae]